MKVKNPNRTEHHKQVFLGNFDAMHRRLGETSKHLNQFWRNLAWLTMSGTPPNVTTLVRVTFCGWSGTYVTFHALEFLFFIFLFLFFCHASRSHLWAIFTTCTPKHVLSVSVPLRLSTMSDYVYGLPQKPPKNLLKWARLRILKSKLRKWKIDLSRKVLSRLTHSFSAS